MKIVLNESDLTDRARASGLEPFAKYYRLEDFIISSELIWKASFICFMSHEICIVFKSRADRFCGKVTRDECFNYLETIY